MTPAARAGAPVVVVTGMGAVTPLAPTLPETFRRLCAGENAIRTIPRFRDAGFPVTIGAEIPFAEEILDRHPDARRYGSRKLAWLDEALDEALAQADLPDLAPHRAGVFLGVETSRIPFARTREIERLAGSAEHRVDISKYGKYCRGLLAPDDVRNKFPAFLACRVAARRGVSGPALATSNACASSNFAIGEALRRLRAGRIDIALVGSADEMIDEYMITGFSLLRALSFDNDRPDRACRPFDGRRSGFVLGEAGAALVLETLESARRRGAAPLVELAGYGATSDGVNITACHPQGEGLRLAMERALSDGGIPREEVAYVNAHGTATRLNDLAETRAIRALFGPLADRIKVNATKSMIGHSVAAAGAVEAAVTVTSMLEGIVHPTRNLESPDPECDLDCCRGGAAELRIGAALSNSCGFSGGNGCLAFRRLEG